MIPDFFTRADIPGVADAEGAAAEAAETVGLDDIEGWFRFAERAERLIEKAGNTIMRMQEFHANGNRSNVIELGETNDEGRVMQTEPVDGHQPVTSGRPGQITAEKIYMKALGSLNFLVKRDPEMKIADALVQARAMKSVVLAEIETALLEMVATDPK